MKFRHPSYSGFVGVARRDITPPIGIPIRNWGAATAFQATGVHQPLTLTALSIANEQGKELTLVTADLGWWRTKEDEWRLRGPLIEVLGLAEDSVIVTLGHTHAGPSLYLEAAYEEGGELMVEYADHLSKVIVEAVQEARSHRQRGLIDWAQGKCGLAVNRDLPHENRMLCGFNPIQAADDTLLIGRVTDAHGNTIATILNYAIHPTTLGPDNSLISPDLVGSARETVEQETGVPCLFIQGACGELSPREQYISDLKVAERHGKCLGHAALSVLYSMTDPGVRLEFDRVVESGASLAVFRAVKNSATTSHLEAKRLGIELPLGDFPTTDDIDQLLEANLSSAEIERLDRKRQVRQTVGEGRSTIVEAIVWQIGDASLISAPLEAYSHLQRQLRSAFPDRCIVVATIANGWYGYLSPIDMYGTAAYQVLQTPFAEGTLETFIAECRAEVSKHK